MEEPFFGGILEERDKKIYLKVSQGRGDRVNKYSIYFLEGGHFLFWLLEDARKAPHLQQNIMK